MILEAGIVDRLFDGQSEFLNLQVQALRDAAAILGVGLCKMADLPLLNLFRDALHVVHDVLDCVIHSSRLRLTPVPRDQLPLSDPMTELDFQFSARPEPLYYSSALGGGRGFLSELGGFARDPFLRRRDGKRTGEADRGCGIPFGTAPQFQFCADQRPLDTL
jgi:hypothetical protein